MINIKNTVDKYANQDGLKTDTQGAEIKNKIGNIAMSDSFSVSEIEAQLAELENVMQEKTEEISKKAEQEFGESLNNYSVQAVEKTALVPVQEESKIIRNIKNMVSKLKNLFNKKESINETEKIDTTSQKESMKKIFSEGFKLSVKLLLDKILGIGAILDVFEFAEVVKDELIKMYGNTNERPIIRNHNRIELAPAR